MQVKKRITFLLPLVLGIITLFALSGDEEAPVMDDPAAALPQATASATNEIIRYSDEEFAGLSDEKKRDIYFNFPQLLPENFNPDAYMSIFHPATEKTES